MRYVAEHKQQTRERILGAAARRFRERGVDGAAIADLMHDLRLTHGGFYRHFRNKEDLLIEAFRHALGRPMAPAVDQLPAEARLEALIGVYLGSNHCGNRAE